MIYFIILEHEMMKPHGDGGSEESEGSHFRSHDPESTTFQNTQSNALCFVLQLNLVKLSPKAISGCYGE